MRQAPPLPPEWHDVVRRKWRETPGFVVAASGDCLEAQVKETRGPRGKVPGREYLAHPLEALDAFRPAGSWFMGILLCPSDEVRGILKWTEGLSQDDVERVAFYVHPDFDRGAMTDWPASVRPRMVEFRGTWQDFHHLYGRHHADRVYQDHHDR